MRLFIAMPIPEKFRDILHGLKDTRLPVRWTPPENYHLTLRFIGEVTESRADEIRQQLHKVEAGEPFEMVLEGLGAFPRPSRPRVIWCAAEPEQPIKTLHSRIQHTLSAVDLEPEDKPFHPHVTLGRVKQSSTAIEEFLKENESFTAGRFRVNQFCLYVSKLGKAGAVHKVVETYPFGNELHKSVDRNEGD